MFRTRSILASRVGRPHGTTSANRPAVHRSAAGAKRAVPLPIAGAFAAFVGASLALLPCAAHAQVVGGQGDGTTSGSGRFQASSGLCLLPSDLPAQVGTRLVLGSCATASKQKLSLGPSIDPVRNGALGTLQSNKLCLDGDPIKGDVSFQPCHAPCQPGAPGGFCYNPGGAFDDGTEGFSLDQSQEWTWNGGEIQAANGRMCLTSNNPIAGAEMALGICSNQKNSANQTFLPLDFYLTFASGLSQPGYQWLGAPTNAPRRIEIVPPAQPFTTFECLDVSANLETTANDPLDDFPCNAALGQWFHFDPNHELLTSAGTCVTAGASAGAPVEVETCADQPLQQWNIDPTTPEIHSLGSGLCLDIANESNVSGTRAVVNPCAFSGTSPAGQAFRLNMVWPTQQIGSNGTGIETPSLLQWDQTSDAAGWSTGWWVDESQQVAGDFDGDGYSDVAFPFKTSDGYIDIDVYLHSEGYIHPQRWSTNLGGWVDGMTFLAGDFDGDGYADIADTFDVGGQLQIDVHLSTGQVAGGFLQPQRWAYDQGGTIGLATWVAGDFDGDHKTDLAYVFSPDGKTTNIDVHVSIGNHQTTSKGFALEHWAAGRGAWQDIAVTDPTSPTFGRSSPYYGTCVQCVRHAQWVAGDFNGDQRMDLGLAYRNPSSEINLDVYLSTPAGFVLQNASISQGGWADQCWWVAADMDDDGLDDMVNVFGDGPLSGVDVDVHSSRITGLTVANAGGFALQRYMSMAPNPFWNQSNDTNVSWWDELNHITTPHDSLGAIFAGGFTVGTSHRFGEIGIVYPVGYYDVSAQTGAQNVGVTILH